MSTTLNIKSQAAMMLQKMKMHGEVDMKKVEEIKEQERGHDFLNLETKMKEDQAKEYQFDHKKIKEIREWKMRELKRRNQYQQSMLKQDEQMNKKFRIYDYWNYKERFHDASTNIQPRNPFFNKEWIGDYIDVAFEIKTHPEAHNRFAPTRLPKIKKQVGILEIMSTEVIDSNSNSVVPTP